MPRIEPIREDHDGFFIEFETHGLQLYLRIETATDYVFSFHSLEAWQFFSLDRFTAEQLAKGFPAYWVDCPPQDRLASTNEAAAQLHRDAAVDWLAQCSFPLYDSECYWEVHMHATIHDPKHLNLYPPGMLHDESSSPFKILQSELQSNGLRHIEEFTWQYCCGLLFNKLLRSTKPRRDPTVFVRNPPCHHGSKEEPVEDSQEYPPDAGNLSPVLPDDVTHQRGPVLASQESLKQIFSHSRKRPVQWGPMFYEEAVAYQNHFCVAGMPRTGKTTLLRLLFQSLHHNTSQAPRFVFYDAKAKLLPYMFRPTETQREWTDDEVAESLYLLTPFDARGTAWDIAKDAADPTAASEIAEIIFPDPDPYRPDPFFSPAARDVATEVMTVLNQKAGTQWTLYDLLSALQLKNVEAVMSANAQSRDVYETYFLDPTSSTGDLRKTLRTKTARLLTASAAWRFAKQRLSLREWVQSDTKSIVLFNLRRQAKACNEINRIVLNLLSQELLASESPAARTFLYLDEFEHLGRIEQMTELAHDGADLKVNLALAYHDLGTLKEVYHGATEGILGDANFRAFLKVTTRETSEWASHQIGAPEVKVKQTGTHRRKTGLDSGQDNDSTDVSETDHYAIRSLVLPDEVRNLPTPEEAHQISGYFMAPKHGPYFGTLPKSEVIRSVDEFADSKESERTKFALWPKANGVSQHCPQPIERYKLPVDTFLTLHQMGFEKPGYPTPPSPPTPSLDKPSEPMRPPSQEQKHPRRRPQDCDFNFELDDD